jgi:ABC-2 type transport system ATP-binding protein
MSIEVKKVSKYYGSQAALKEVSLSLKEGDIVGFLGPNGAGKSTLMKIICCYLSKDEGEVNVCGLNTDKDTLEIKSKIGYLAENNPLYSEMYIKEYLDFVAGIYSISKKKINEMISLTGLEREQHKKISQLSKGYKQRVGLAAALIHDPEVLILDEPTTGLDPNQLVEIRNLIKECGKNKTVLLSTHIMQEVERICNRVIVINKGQIVANEKLDQLKSNNVDLESYFQKLTQ